MNKKRSFFSLARGGRNIPEPPKPVVNRFYKGTDLIQIQNSMQRCFDAKREALGIFFARTREVFAASDIEEVLLEGVADKFGLEGPMIHGSYRQDFVFGWKLPNDGVAIFTASYLEPSTPDIPADGLDLLDDWRNGTFDFALGMTLKDSNYNTSFSVPRVGPPIKPMLPDWFVRPMRALVPETA